MDWQINVPGGWGAVGAGGLAILGLILWLSRRYIDHYLTRKEKEYNLLLLQQEETFKAKLKDQETEHKAKIDIETEKLQLQMSEAKNIAQLYSSIDKLIITIQQGQQNIQQGQEKAAIERKEMRDTFDEIASNTQTQVTDLKAYIHSEVDAMTRLIRELTAVFEGSIEALAGMLDNPSKWVTDIQMQEEINMIRGEIQSQTIAIMRHLSTIGGKVSLEHREATSLSDSIEQGTPAGEA